MGKDGQYVVFLVASDAGSSVGEPIWGCEIDGFIKIQLVRAQLNPKRRRFSTAHPVIEASVIRLGKGDDKFASLLVTCKNPHACFS